MRPLEARLPFNLKQPQDNTYGMLLLSRFRLDRPEVRFLVEDDVPSMLATVVPPDSRPIQLYCLHPRPPQIGKPGTTARDAELIVVGYQIRHPDQPIIVAGDLNDVAWSYTTNLFQRISGLLDPRRGRGMFNTFSANNPLVRFPLDHIFHSAHFRLVSMRRLPPFGSDHFPILAELSYERNAIAHQEPPSADREDLKLGRRLIRRAR